MQGEESSTCDLDCHVGDEDVHDSLFNLLATLYNFKNWLQRGSRDNLLVRDDCVNYLWSGIRPNRRQAS